MPGEDDDGFESEAGDLAEGLIEDGVEQVPLAESRAEVEFVGGEVFIGEAVGFGVGGVVVVDLQAVGGGGRSVVNGGEDDAAGLLGGADAEGVGFDAVESDGVVGAVPFEQSEGQVGERGLFAEGLELVGSESFGLVGHGV